MLPVFHIVGQILKSTSTKRRASADSRAARHMETLSPHNEKPKKSLSSLIL